MIRKPQLESTFARAVVPVVAGIGFFALLGLALWGVAALTSRHPNETSDLLAGRRFRPAHSSVYASIIERDGPIMFPDLIGTDGDLTVVLDHTGDDPGFGWQMYMAHPADRPLSCKVAQVPHTRNFTDCDGRTLPVERLALPAQGMSVVVWRDGMLELDLVADRRNPATTPSVTTA